MRLRDMRSAENGAGAAGRARLRSELQAQLQDLLVEVWAQERFERTHPFTCAVIREAAG